MNRQRPALSIVENLDDIDEDSPAEAPLAFSFRLPPQNVLTALLHDSARPLTGDQRFAPTRWLLLCCYEATHGLGCALSEVHKGPNIAHAVRERAMTSLFTRLIGASSGHAKSQPDDSKLYAEAVVIHRRARAVSGSAAPSQSMRRWLLAEPSALARVIAAPTKVAMQHPTTSQKGTPAMVRRGPAPAAAYPTLHGWPVERTHEKGFLSGTARGLQPTAGEEATLRDIWQC